MPATGATGSGGEFRVLDRKPLRGRRVEKIDLRSVEKQREFFIGNNKNAVVIVFDVDQRIKLRVKSKRVLHAAASPAYDHRSHEGVRIELLRLYNRFNFFNRAFRKFNHRNVSFVLRRFPFQSYPPRTPGRRLALKLNLSL